MQPLNPKVKVPAIVGSIVTIGLAVLAAAGTVPELAPVATAGTTALTTLSGYFAYAD